MEVGRPTYVLSKNKIESQKGVTNNLQIYFKVHDMYSISFLCNTANTLHISSKSLHISTHSYYTSKLKVSVNEVEKTFNIKQIEDWYKIKSDVFPPSIYKTNPTRISTKYLDQNLSTRTDLLPFYSYLHYIPIMNGFLGNSLKHHATIGVPQKTNVDSWIGSPSNSIS